MNTDAWQQLKSLESRDLVSSWFFKLHGRELNARRSKEIIAAARQGREFFRNASMADFSVKPLLTFYGVASLSRATTLLFRRDGGEETLVKGHGLETHSWSQDLAGELSAGLTKIANLKVRIVEGLFYDFLSSTNNEMTFHVHTSAVDWLVPYPIPATKAEISLGDLLGRMPDLTGDFAAVSPDHFVGRVSEMRFSELEGLVASAVCDDVYKMRDAYSDLGLSTEFSDKTLTLRTSAASFQAQPPQFVHAYLQKLFNSIPSLHLTVPLPGNIRLSQLAQTYVISYFLGMLARYFPTYWIALVQGEKGDAIWPTLNHAHKLGRKLINRIPRRCGL